MPSALDMEMDAAVAALTAPGALFEAVPAAYRGQIVPAIKRAPASLPAFFDHFCALHGAAEFLVDGPVRRSFAQTHALASRLARALIADFGVVPGQRVGIAARNSANWVIAYMAVLMAGGCATLLNGWWTGEELAEGIRLTDAALVLADAARAERLAGTTFGARVVVFAHGEFESGFADVLAGAGGDDIALPEMAGDDLATILFTSGSTGTAKGAWSSQRAVVHGALSFASITLSFLEILTKRGTTPASQPATLIAVPLFHVTGAVPLLLQSFVIGRKVALMARWDAAEAMQLIAAERVTYFLGVPLMSFEIASHPERANYDLTSCVHFAAGGAPRPVAHVGRLRQSIPHAFPLLGYGLTETNAVGCGNFNENYLAKPTSTGRPTKPLVEVAIVDEAGGHLPTGETGEVAIRSLANFGGYWQNPEASATAFTPDGYFRSGDLGYLDADGYLFIVDRKKDIVIRGGENISCIEVEQAIYAHPDIAEASVFGRACERYGEVPVAVWLAKPGRGLTEAQLRDFLKIQLAAFKIPVELWQAEGRLPRLGTEKVDKRALKARYAGGG